jgi:asparagine synthase (glutamine-hydrolysing)
MCGIVGQVGGNDTPARVESVLRRQLALLHHRGPDDSGYVVEPQFAFGHARLAIIDPDLGHQPFASADGELVITFNGEIYNYLELREELVRAGHAFRTTSDTEVLLTGYRHWGPEVLQKIDGMFAFALYDKRSRTLFCARDPYGQKPFFYSLHEGRFRVLVECRTFDLLSGFRAEIDPRRSSISGVRIVAVRSLIYRGVRKLPPGHCFSLIRRQDRSCALFRVDARGAAASVPEASLDAEIHELLRQSVKRTFRADVPVGLLLSGGLDSSLVLAILREVHPSVPLKTFTIRNVDRSFDESAAAALLSDQFQTRHTVVTAEPSALAAIASSIPALLDEPQADPGILPKYMICGEIARTTKVALTGDGGDEFFYGYAIFRAQRLARMAKRLPDALHRRVIRPLTQRIPASSRYMSLDLKIKQFAKGFPAPDHLRNFYWTCAFSDHDLPALLLERGHNFDDLTRQLAMLQSRWQTANGELGRLAYLYQQQYLPDYVLPNSDRSSMLHSVELRTPFLATELVRKVNSLPDSVKMRGGETKSILRRIATGLLPPEISRGRKMGFTAPVASLIRNELKEEILEFLGGPYLRRQGLFREEYVTRL